MAAVFLKHVIRASLLLACLLSVELSGKYTYQINVDGLDGFPKIAKKAKLLSALISDDQNALSIHSLSSLRDQLKKDIAKIKDYLASQGFYDVRLFTEFLTENHQDKVTIHVRLGERYIINKVSVFVNGQLFSLPEEVKLQALKGSASVHENILSDKQIIGDFFRSSGHAFVDVEDEIVEINHDTLLVNITYTFGISPQGNFGQTTLVGNKSVNSEYIAKFLNWSPRETYNASKLQAAEKKLLETRLFDSVLIKPLSLNDKGEYPIKILLEEAKMQHVRLGGYVNFNLGGGRSREMGVVPKYMHDNVFGNNERFEVNMIIANVTQDINISMLKPNVFTMDTSGKVILSAERRETDIYEKTAINSSVGLEYKLFSSLSFKWEAGLERYDLKSAVDKAESSFLFAYFPFDVHYDGRDNQFFSQSGINLVADWTPYLGNQSNLYRAAVKLSTYLPLWRGNWVVASWVSWEALYGVPFKESPLDKRVYLGGINNLRGFPSQSIGDAQHSSSLGREVPDGGLSSAAAGIESRMRIYGPVWWALFLESGQLSKSTSVFANTNSMGDMYWDTGASMFYFTQFGPFRVDIAFPIKREITFSDLQVHISFGQAF